MGQTGPSQVQAQLGTELRLVDGGELGRRHDAGAGRVGHVDDGPHDQRGVLAVLGHLRVALVLKTQKQQRTLL